MSGQSEPGSNGNEQVLRIPQSSSITGNIFENVGFFSNISPRAKHVLNTFKLRTLCACLYLFVVYILFVPVISTSIHRYVNYSNIQVLMMVTETETFNVDTINSPILIILFFFFFFPHTVGFSSIFTFIMKSTLCIYIGFYLLYNKVLISVCLFYRLCNKV